MSQHHQIKTFKGFSRHENSVLITAWTDMIQTQHIMSLNHGDLKQKEKKALISSIGKLMCL